MLTSVGVSTHGLGGRAERQQSERWTMMSLMRNEPTDTLVPLGQAMNRLLEESFLGLGRFDIFGRTMPLDIRETEHEFVVEAAAPGIKLEELQISVTGDTLTIFAEHKAEEKEDKAKGYIRRERYLGEMYRTVRLPISVDADKIAATYENGILTIHLPKGEKALPKRVPITAKEPAHVS